MWKHKVVAMAIVTGGRNNQAGLKKALAMNTLGIVLNDIVLRYIIDSGYNFSFPVTFSAEERNIHLVGTGFRIGIMQNIVVTMTLFTTGCIWVIH